MKLVPVLTEKSLSQANEGEYTFWVERNMNKGQIRKVIEKVFDVHVTRVRTINLKGRKERDLKGRIRFISPKKKAIVRLKDKEKIDLFETEGKKKKK